MSFLKNIEAIRQRVRQTMEDGAVTHDYRLDRMQAVRYVDVGTSGGVWGVERG